MNLLPRVQIEMQEDDKSLWSLCPVQDIDTVLTNRYGDADNTISLLYCGIYLRQFKESLKRTMLDQESVFEHQIHELHRLYQRQKDLMIEMEETNNLCSQARHLLSSNVEDSSARASINWMSSSIATSKATVLPQIDASTKIDEAGISGDESEKAREMVLDLELPSYGYLGSKNVQHLTGLSRSECVLDLNEPAKTEEHSDCELNLFLSPVQTRSERAEPEAQDRASTKSQVEKGINLNVCPPHSSEEVITSKKIKPEQPREFLAVPIREIVLALPCAKAISLFYKRSSLWPRKKGKRKAKFITTETFPRSKARKRSNLDSSFIVNEDDNHSLSTASYISRSDHNQEHQTRNWTNTRKRGQCKAQTESGKVMRKNARTKPKTRGRFLVTEEEDEKKSAAAEAIVELSLSDFKTSDYISPLRWFANIASSVVEDSKSEFGLSVTGSHSDYEIDYFEAMSLQLTEMKPKEQRTNTSVSKKTKCSQGKRQQQHEENLPSISTFTANKATQDLEKIESLIKASEMIDDHSCLMENTVIDWGTKRKRRRGIRIPSTNTKNSIALLQLPY